MSLDDYKTAWRAQSAAGYFPLNEELHHLIGALTRSHRRDRIILAVCAVNSVVALLAVVWILLFRRPSSWEQLLPLLALQVVLAIGLGVLIQRHQQRRKALESSTQTVHQATGEALRAATGQMRDLRLLLVLAAIAVPVIILAVNRLMAAGKMNAQAALSFGLVCAAVFAVNAVVLGRKWRRLVSSSNRLEQIRAALEKE